MAAEDRYVRLLESEMDTEGFRRCRGAAFKVYMVLRRIASWEDSTACHASRFICWRVGVTHVNLLSQMRKLEKAGLLVFERIHKGQPRYDEKGKRLFTKWRLNGFDGQPLLFRNRNLNVSESKLKGSENETNTNKGLSRPNTNKDGEEKEPAKPGLQGATQKIGTAPDNGGGKTGEHPGNASPDSDEMGKTRAYLRGKNVRGRTLEELVATTSLKKAQTCWEITRVAIGKGLIKAKYGENADEAITSYFIGVCRNKFKSSIRPSTLDSDAAPTARGAGAAAAAGGGVDSQVNGEAKRPANRPGGASANGDSAENSPFSKKELAVLKSRAASGRGNQPQKLGVSDD